ncbi:hypothetical protein QJS04_geneDACA018477 [Acorus gramineus]|uniref:RING-type E3 ubiquitin transferase n=1 Tax=Acorus gramineus TaxID=55184 RepID=A0AAV9AY15_ACOGR|nr:hypothetical protein QJS04_geneDACA018477 [Acorus gramineus]
MVSGLTEDRFRRLRNTTTTTAQSDGPIEEAEPESHRRIGRPAKDKKKGLAYAAFRGLGCASASRVSAPELVVRSSAEWDRKGRAENAHSSSARKVRKEKGKKDQTAVTTGGCGGDASVDLCCSPGMVLAAAAVADAECVVVSPVRAPPGRGRSQRERHCIGRGSSIQESISLFDSPSPPRARRGRYLHSRRFHHSPEGLSEIMMFQTRMLLGGMDGYDRYRDWRLDIDDMSYEELLELEDSIGYVSTGLREEEIHLCLRRGKFKNFEALPLQFSSGNDWKCSVCQEEYDVNDEIGKLDCGHSYHISCIKKWLSQKNACPVCKAAVRC